MTSHSLVSIVLPTYNGSKYLREAIESCLAQTYSDWELIVVDDYSTDETPQIIAAYCALDSRIRSVRHIVNRGLPSALNSGFADSKGAYLTWISDDNRYHSDALSEMVGFLHGHSDIDMVYADFTRMNQDGNPIDVYKVEEPIRMHRGNAFGACFLYRRRVYEALGNYSEDLFTAEDYDYWLRVASTFRVMPLHKTLYSYRMHSKSLTSSREYPKLQKVADKALARNLPHLHWLTPQEKALTFWRLARRAYILRYGIQSVLRYLGGAMAQSPGRTAKLLLSLALRTPGKVISFGIKRFRAAPSPGQNVPIKTNE